MARDEMADGGEQCDEDQCCDNPQWAELPKRAAKLPGRRFRETYGECVNCGATEE